MFTKNLINIQKYKEKKEEFTFRYNEILKRLPNFNLQEFINIYNLKGANLILDNLNYENKSMENEKIQDLKKLNELKDYISDYLNHFHIYAEKMSEKDYNKEKLQVIYEFYFSLSSSLKDDTVLKKIETIWSEINSLESTVLYIKNDDLQNYQNVFKSCYDRIVHLVKIKF